MFWVSAGEFQTHEGREERDDEGSLFCVSRARNVSIRLSLIKEEGGGGELSASLKTFQNPEGAGDLIFLITNKSYFFFRGTEIEVLERGN